MNSPSNTILKPKNINDLEKYFDFNYMIRPLFRDRVRKEKELIDEHLDSYYFELEDQSFYNWVETELQDVIKGYDPNEHTHDIVYLARYFEKHGHRYMHGVDFDKSKRELSREIDFFIEGEAKVDLEKLKEKAKTEVTVLSH
ncbi:MAG: hypothetical protein IH948_02235 [Bacteroidetes bacterium]|nr:hypothetical protein [Bacteroidota bacterium]